MSKILITEIFKLPVDQQESVFQAELDRITTIGCDDPLSGLNEMINLLQGINIALIQAYAPPLIGAAQTNKVVTRHEKKAVACLAQLQVAVTKLGMATVKVQNAIKRRALRAASPANNDNKVPRAPAINHENRL